MVVILRLQTFRMASLAVLVFCSFAAAQEDDDAAPPAEDDAPPAAGAPSPDGKAVAPPAGGGEATILPKPQGGDKIHMKSGTVMSGVQVLRSNPANYEVQVIAGEEPMLIPRRQVERVEYDDIDPVLDEMRERMFPKPKEVTIASGERVTSELRDKLEAPIGAEVITYQDQDLVAVLNDIKTRTEVKLIVDPSIEERPAGQRKWSLEVPAGRTLMDVLRTDMIGRFNYVEVVLETDTVLVMTKDAAKKRAEAAAAAGGAPAGEAPAAAPPPAQTPPAAAPAQLPPLGRPKPPAE